MEKIDILSMTKDELSAWITSLGEPKFRAANLLLLPVRSQSKNRSPATEP